MNLTFSSHLHQPMFTCLTSHFLVECLLNRGPICSLCFNIFSFHRLLSFQGWMFLWRRRCCWSWGYLVFSKYSTALCVMLSHVCGQFGYSSLKHFFVPSLIGRGIHTEGWGLLKCFLLQYACMSAFCKAMCCSSLSSTCAGLVSVEFVCVGNCRSTELHKTSFPVEKIFLIT